MHPIVFRLTLTPHVATGVLFALAIAIPGFYAYRAWQDFRDGLVEDRSRIWRHGVGGLILGLLLLTVVIRPWAWQQNLDLPLHTYGLMMAIGFLAAITVASREARRCGLDVDHVLDLAFWILIAGLVGARILFILVNHDLYFGDHFFSTDVRIPRIGWHVPNILLVWRGGLVFFGGLIGAFVATTLYLRRTGLPTFRYLDALAPSIPLGHFFGRLGCFSAGCCWGKPADPNSFVAAFFPEGSLAFAQTSPSTHVEHLGALTTQAVYPTQLFESLGVLLIFFALVWIRSRKRFHGQVLISYFILYPLFRIGNEVFRGDWERGLLFAWPAKNPVMLSTSQIIAFGVAATGLALLAYLKKKKKKMHEQDEPETAGTTGP